MKAGRNEIDALDELAEIPNRRRKSVADKPVLIEHRLWDSVPQSVRECWDVTIEERLEWYPKTVLAVDVMYGGKPDGLVDCLLSEIVERTVVNRTGFAEGRIS